MDSLVHLAAEYFPDVNFDYVTATEGMQKWRGLVDDIPPQITVNTFDYGDSLEVTIMVDEPIWQVAPLVWANAGGEHLVTLYPDQLSPLSWRVTLQTTNRTYDAIGIGATDTSGNATAKTVWLNPVSISNGMDDMLLTQPVLHSAYPNPFNASTTFKFEIPKESSVNMTIYDVLGREVTRLVESRLERGYHQIVWNGRAHDGTDMPSGIYIARLVTPTYTGSVKMLLLK